MIVIISCCSETIIITTIIMNIIFRPRLNIVILHSDAAESLGWTTFVGMAPRYFNLFFYYYTWHGPWFFFHFVFAASLWSRTLCHCSRPLIMQPFLLKQNQTRPQDDFEYIHFVPTWTVSVYNIYIHTVMWY